MSNGAGRIAVALGAVLMFTTMALSQERSQLKALTLLQPGLWEMRDLDNPRAPRQSICLIDPDVVMQVQHRNAPCSRLVIANAAKAATVHYTCPSTGFGRTSIRVETPRLATIDTQGIDNNMPFAYRAELRRKGPCARVRKAVAN